MKTLYLLILAFVILLAVQVLTHNQATALCLPNPDWPSAPCYGCPGCTPNQEKQREDWNPYYEYKGTKFMEMMQNQMIGAIQNGTLHDWVNNNQTNYDVWRYYYLNDQAPFFNPSTEQNASHYIFSPLQQFKSGIRPADTTCKMGFQLIFKFEDGSPACVKQQTTQTLVERGWAKQESYYVDPHMNPKVSLYDYFYDGINKDNTTVSINNQTYYQTTLNYTVDNLRKNTSTQFHGVTFVFLEGILDTPGGSMIILDVKFSDGYEETYGKKSMNQDGSGSGSGIAIPSKFGPPATTSITVLSTHVMPQAGLTIYHDKIKLLVSK